MTWRNPHKHMWWSISYMIPANSIDKHEVNAPKKAQCRGFWRARSKTARSVVDHVLGSCTELLVSLNHFVHCIKEVFLRHSLPSSSDGIHSSFCAHASYVGSWEKLMSEYQTSKHTPGLVNKYKPVGPWNTMGQHLVRRQVEIDPLPWK